MIQLPIFKKYKKILRELHVSESFKVAMQLMDTRYNYCNKLLNINKKTIEFGEYLIFDKTKKEKVSYKNNNFLIYCIEDKYCIHYAILE